MELSIQPGDPYVYLFSIVNAIVDRRKEKLGIKTKEVPFYNWLEGEK